MTTTYTSGLRLTNQPTGGNPNIWGDIADTNFEHLDDAVTAQLSVDMTGASSKTLTVNNGSDDEARNAALFIHGTPTSANSVIIPAAQKPYMIRTAHTSIAGGVTVRTASGTGVNFLSGKTGIVYCDGVSVYTYADITTEVSALDPSNNLSDLEDVSVARDNLGLQPQSPLETDGTNLTFNTSTLFDGIWPVGSIYMNRTDGTNPGTLMSFGTWVSAGVGRVPVGVGTGTDVNTVSVVFTAETCGGEYVHTMTTAELVDHSHKIPGSQTLGGGTPVAAVRGPEDSAEFLTSTVGSSEPFNIQQPWYSVYMWVRTV